MDKKIFIGIIVGLVFVIFFLIFVIMLVQQRKVELENPVPTMYPTPSPTIIVDARPTVRPTTIQGEPLTVVNTDPVDKASNVPINTDIAITFNKMFNLEDFIFAITPNVKYRMTYDRTTLKAFIVTDELLQPNTVYTFKVNTFKQLPKTFTFTTGEATGTAKIKL